MSKTYIFFLFFCFGCLHDPKPVNFSEIVELFNKNKNDFSTTPNRLNEKFFSSELNNVKKILKRLRTVNIDDLTDEQKIDHQFIESLLVGKEITYENIQSWKRDPRDYMNFRTLSSNLNGPKSCEEKAVFFAKNLTYHL